MCSDHSSQDDSADNGAVGGSIQANLWLVLFPAAMWSNRVGVILAGRVRRALWRGDAEQAQVNFVVCTGSALARYE